MRIIRVSLSNLKRSRTPMCACIGYFDGLHKGHQKLLSETVAMAKRHNCETGMITFDPDPWVVIKGMQHVRHISTMRQRMNLAVKLGMDNIILLEFTREMSELSPQDFIDKVLGSLNLQGLVCGFDFHFAYKGTGDTEFLKAHVPYEVEVVPPVEDEHGKISSTRISQCITEGRMEEAERMLGYPFAIEGKVVHGRHRGTGMGFPTANVEFDDEYLLPKTGVYAGIATVGRKSYEAMINLGRNPTFNDIDHLSLEAYLLDFSGDLYDRHISLAFLKYIRPEVRFQNKNNLIMQLEQDLRDIRDYFDHE